MVRTSQTPPIAYDARSCRYEPTQRFVTFLLLDFDRQTLQTGERKEQPPQKKSHGLRTLPIIPAGKHQNATPRRQIVVVIILATYVVG